MHADYDENQIGEIDYKTRLRTDQDFASELYLRTIQTWTKNIILYCFISYFYVF